MPPNRTERLLNLLNVVVGADRPVPAAELRRRVPGYPDDDASFHRQFERDKAAIRDLGLPMEPITNPSNPEDPPGYRIRRDEAYLRDPGLEPDELAALNLAAEAVRLEGLEGRAALWALGGRPTGTGATTDPAPGGGEASAAPGGVARPGDVAVPGDVVAPGDVAPPGDVALPGDERLATLFAAVTERRRVRFTYRGESRDVDPYRLQASRGRWYLTGHDHLRGAVRNYRLGRIEGGVRAGPPGAFDAPAERPPLSFDAWEYGSAPPVTARLLVDADHVDEVRSLAHRAEIAEERADGAAVFELRVTDRDAFRGMVLGLLEHAEVLDPAELRDDLVHWLEAIAGRPGERASQ
ncbi:MAG: WYL domain-containing protein [Actinobacteria bacterium]|nr:WYL domain-containing protein [Actinomycetota bacterium]